MQDVSSCSSAAARHHPPSRPVLVYGAAGHTGRFVVAALLHVGLAVQVAGRDAARLAAAHPTLVRHTAATDDPVALARALQGVALVVNCAGPFADSADALLRAACAAGAHYVDIGAEQAVAREVFTHRDAPFAAAGLCAVPALGFYGGLGDLLATAAADDWADAGQGLDCIDHYIALDSWHPTAGTRKTGQRNAGRYCVWRGGRFEPPPAPAPTTRWRFAAPFGDQPMTGLPVADTVTLAHHLRVRDIASWINDTPLAELRNADTPPPRPVDASGRSAQRFAVETVVRRGQAERRATAHGQDIYAVTGPLVAQAVLRVLQGDQVGALTGGQLGDARVLLASLAPEPLVVAW